MKTAAVFVILLIALWAAAQAPPAAPDLARYIPSGPILYLEARDFSGLLRDWNTSAEKRTWLTSDNFAVFSRSRLFERLKQAQEEFTAAAGVPAKMPLVESVAGSESAIAVFDIGKLEFLYITRLAGAKALENALWQTRAKFTSRNAAGQDFYVHTDPASRRTVGFAATKDFLVLGTREDLIAGSLMLMAGQNASSVKQDGWFDQSVRAAASTPGDLRMVLNMPALVRSPHFRSYWIQSNVTLLRPYAAGISDLRRSATEYREERLLLRTEPVDAPASPATVAQLIRLVPDDAGLYRAWAHPSVNDAVALLEAKVLYPRVSVGPASYMAPAMVNQADPGTAADLEIRINEAPFAESGRSFDRGPVTQLIQNAKLEGMLQIQSTRLLPDRVFVRTESAIVLLAATDWPAGTTFPDVYTAVRGKLLIVSTSQALINSISSRIGNQAGSEAAVYAALFRHGRERANFERMTRGIDYPRRQSGEPLFFSRNIASLSRTLARLDSESIVVADAGTALKQTVVYRMTR